MENQEKKIEEGLMLWHGAEGELYVPAEEYKDFAKWVLSIYQQGYEAGRAAGYNSLLKNIRKLEIKNRGRDISFIMIDNIGEVDWDKVPALSNNPTENKNGHRIDGKGNLTYDERCSGGKCEAPKIKDDPTGESFYPKNEMLDSERKRMEQENKEYNDSLDAQRGEE